MPFFFDLPREIRDIIYEHVLVSPTGYIQPILTTKKSLTATPQFALYIVLPPQDPSNQRTLIQYSMPELADVSSASSYLSLSLPRVSRQIHGETTSLFWRKNTFTFSSSQHLISTLRTISQIPSRLIVHTTLSLSSSFTKDLPRALRLLASRARLGSFRHLTLTISRKELIAIEGCKMSADPKRTAQYDGLLEMLRDGGMEKGFEKVMRVETLLREWRVGGGLDHDTARELHLAWGGRMVVNGEVEWVDFVHVGRFAGFK